MLEERKCRITVDPMLGSYNPAQKAHQRVPGYPEVRAATFIAGLYRYCSQSALVLRKAIAHSAAAHRNDTIPSGARIMNVPVKSKTIVAARPLAGRVSLVTGSTSGIGLGIACALAAAGSEIILNGFGSPENIAEAQAQIASEFNVRVLHSPADMSKPASIREMI